MAPGAISQQQGLQGTVPTHGNRGLRKGRSAAGQRHRASSVLRALPGTSAKPQLRLPGVSWARECVSSLSSVSPAKCRLLGSLPPEGKPVAFQPSVANQMFSTLHFLCFKNTHLERGTEVE